MPDINKLMSNDLIRDQIFMHLSPRDVVNYQTATGIKFTTEEFERYVNVFRFIIPQRRWLMNKINNEGYTFTVLCKTLHDFPNAETEDVTHYVYLFVTDKNGDFVSCNEDFIPDAMFESAELDIRLFKDRPFKIPTRVLLMRFGHLEERILTQMPAERRNGAPLPQGEVTTGTFEKSQRVSGYGGPLFTVDFLMYYSIVYSAMRICWDMLPNDSWPTMCAVMDSNGYTIKHLLPMKVRIPGSRESSSSKENKRKKPIKTKKTRRKGLRGEEVEQEYETNINSEDDLEGSCSSSDSAASSGSLNQQQKKIETLFSLQLLNKRMKWPYKGLIYHIPRTRAECSDKYDGLYRAPPKY